MHRFNHGNDNPILNDALLQEAYQNGRLRALNEKTSPPIGGGPIGGGGMGGDPFKPPELTAFEYNETALPNYWQFLQGYFDWTGLDFGGNFLEWWASLGTLGPDFDWSQYGFTWVEGSNGQAGYWQGNVGFGDGPWWDPDNPYCGCLECGNCESWVSMVWNGQTWIVGLDQQ